MKPMNYAYLAKKYLHADVVVHDRTYDGLEWFGPGEKPPLSVFEAFQGEEDREARVLRKEHESRLGIMEERQVQARAKALEDIRPFEDKLREIEEEGRRKALELRQEAIELQSALRSRSHVLDAWKEISAAEALLADEAQRYLEETAHYLSWDQHKIPAEVLVGREKAHSQIAAGKLVYADWARLRSNEMPSRAEIQEAIKLGGEHLKRIKKACQEAALRYPKPRRNHY